LLLKLFRARERGGKISTRKEPKTSHLGLFTPRRLPKTTVHSSDTIITPSRGITTTCGYSITMLFSIASQLMLASLTSAAIFFDPTAVKHSCVNEDGSTLTPGIPVHLTDVNTEASSQTILLKPILPTTVVLGASDTDAFMCVFHRWTMPLEDKQNGEGFYYALGRSVPRIPADVLGNSTGSVGDWARP
jgi:hypothetical protein